MISRGPVQQHPLWRWCFHWLNIWTRRLSIVQKCVAITHKFQAVLSINSELFSLARKPLNIGGQVLNLRWHGVGGSLGQVADVDPTLPPSHAEGDLTSDADRKFGGRIAGGPRHTPLALTSPIVGPQDDSASMLDLLRWWDMPQRGYCPPSPRPYRWTTRQQGWPPSSVEKIQTFYFFLRLPSSSSSAASPSYHCSTLARKAGYGTKG